MNPPSSNPPGPSSNDQNSPRLIAWTSAGIPEPWVRRSLTPFCERYSDHLHWIAQPEAGWDVGGEADWDILFLGSDLGTAGLTLEMAVRRASRAHPLNCIVAVVHEATPAIQIALLRAGAVDVIAREDSTERIEQALDLAISILQARQAQSEQEKLRLIRQLAVSINHEINNPLTGLLGTVDLILMENRSLSEKTLRDLRVVSEQGRRIQEVTARLKGLNQIRTIPYGAHDSMLDLLGTSHPERPIPRPTVQEMFLPAPMVLVVDDNPLIIDLIARLYQGRIQIYAAGTASDALQMVESNAYDLVLIDLILPEMNGLELFRAVRRLKPHQRIMIMTAYLGDPRVEQAVAEGALCSINKPFQLEELERTLGEALKPR